MNAFAIDLLEYLKTVGDSLLGTRHSLMKNRLEKLSRMESSRASYVMCCEMAYQIAEVGHVLSSHIEARMLLEEKNYWVDLYFRSFKDHG